LIAEQFSNRAAAVVTAQNCGSTIQLDANAATPPAADYFEARSLTPVTDFKILIQKLSCIVPLLQEVTL
jgi:hypothetical protein